MPRQPRVYLDTGILLDRADGRISLELMRRFDAAVLRVNAHTVVTISHLWDIHASASLDGRNRAVSSIESLPNLRGVVLAPVQIEEPRIEAALRGKPLHEDAPDIVLGPIEDLAALVAATQNGSVALSQMGTGMAQAGNTSRSARSTPDAANVEEFIRRLMEGESPTELLASLKLGEDAVRDLVAAVSVLDPVMERARDILRRNMEGIGGDPERLARVLRRTRGTPADLRWSSTKNGEQRWHEAAKRHGPGLYVSKRLSQVRATDAGRGLKSSDLADADHATYLPYMDFATVDRENYGTVQQALRELEPPKAVLLFRNGVFGELVDALERI